MADGKAAARGVRLAVDVGSVRVGVAACDAAGLLAVPLTTLRRDADGGADVRAVVELAAERGAVEVLVGLPLQLDGREGSAARAVRDWVAQLGAAAPGLPVRLVDERLSTVSAHGAMAQAGRDSRARRDVVDQAAAVVILSTFLDAQRAGRPLPGTVLGSGARRARRPRARTKERNE